MALGKKTGGRQKGSKNLSTRDMRAKAQAYGDDMIEVLVKIAKNAKLPPHDRITAAEKVLDRGYGKPTQQIKTTDTSERYDLSKIAPDKLRMIADTLRIAQRPGIVIDHE
jgi:hypothetical protein